MREMSHRYAAVLAADVAQYSRLMERDGEGTVAALNDCRDIFRRRVTSHHGREFGRAGDSLMAEFGSAVEALRAARDIQADLAHDSETESGDQCLDMRIGIHAGDVIADGQDIYGDVVNVAARLQGFARPGGVAMSEFVYAQVHKEAGCAFSSLGRQPLHNIEEPIRVYELRRREHPFSARRLRFAMSRYMPAIAAVLGAMIVGLLLLAFLNQPEERGLGPTTDVPAD